MKGLVLLLGLAAVAALAVGGGDALQQPVVPAVFVLGDSTLDVGNNNHLPGEGVPRANTPFYGVDFPGGPKATGQFSNGYNIADFIASRVREKPFGLSGAQITELPHPQRSHQRRELASAGAGILDSTNAGDNIPLSKQVRYFASTKAEMEAAWGTHRVSAHLANSFLLGIGSNDMFQTKPKSTAEVAALYATLVSNYSTAITDLYGLGARKFGIINVGPVGCVPRVRVLNATGACNDALNLYAVGLAAAVKSALAGLAPKLPGFAYSLADSFAASQASFTDPQSVGFVSSDSACCGSGRLGAESLCMKNVTLCPNRDTYAFWDSVHPTQRAAELVAQGVFDGPTQLTTPINFKQLAHKRY
uniref:Uncharacterized protein n=1 Tax=Avena sativa TaxID=4498 RepID=A0ACD5ZT18_AVESA